MEGKNLKFFAPKSSSDLFTTGGVEMKTQLDINIRGVSIPTDPSAKILRSVLDSSLKFTKQAEEVTKTPSKLRQRLKTQTARVTKHSPRLKKGRSKNSSDLKRELNIIHTQAVEEALSTFKGSIVFGGWPPCISNAEL